MNPQSCSQNAYAISTLPSGVWLGLDFGLARIGVAIGNTLTKGARPLVTLDEREKDQRFASLAELITAWQPVGLVLGLPMNTRETVEEGSSSKVLSQQLKSKKHRLASQVRRFAKQLRERFGLPVVLVDERYSTAILANSYPAALHNTRSKPHHAKNPPKKNKEGIDAWAAAVILQHFFDQSQENVR